MSKMPDHITDSSPPADKPEADPDAAYDEQRQRRLDEDQRLISDLNVAIAHVSKHNSFDVLELVALLKRARNRIYDR